MHISRKHAEGDHGGRPRRLWVMPRSKVANNAARQLSVDAVPKADISTTLLPEALNLKIELVATGSLKGYEGQARRHGRKQLTQIAASIRQHGFVDPVLIDPDGVIVAGHGRVLAAQQLGLATVPAIRAGHLSPAELRVLRLALNKLPMGASWDPEALAAELQSLEGLRLNTPLELTGFDGAELDSLLELQPAPKPDKADRLPKVTGPAVTRLGDRWLMGDHVLHCADALEPASYEVLMGGELASMVFADAPYNCEIDGNVSGLGAVTHREFVMASGELSDAEFRGFLKTTMANAAAVSADGAIHFQCIDWKGLPLLLAAGAEVYQEQKNLIVWVKSNGGMGSFYRSRHELIAVFKVGTAPHTNNFGLGATGRYRTNVWEYPGLSAFGADRDAALSQHPTTKPVAMVADAIKDVSRRHEIVLDPFGGSGTTLIAAQKTGRRSRLLELDPLYCDVICRRWETFTGQPAVLEASGATFAEVQSTREKHDDQI